MEEISDALLEGAIISSETLKSALTVAYSIILSEGSSYLAALTVGALTTVVVGLVDSAAPFADLAGFVVGYLGGLALAEFIPEELAEMLADATLGGADGTAYVSAIMASWQEQFQETGLFTEYLLQSIFGGSDIFRGVRIPDLSNTDDTVEPDYIDGIETYNYTGENPWLDLRSKSNQVLVDLHAGTITSGGSNSATNSYQDVLGTSGNDVILGNSQTNYIDGGAGNDVIDGREGVDIAIYATATQGVTVDLTLNGPQPTGQGNDTLISIEGVVGSRFADTLQGNNEDNIIIGGGGGDTMLGRGGDDLFIVDRISFDEVDGGDGVDTISYQDTVRVALNANLAASTIQQILHTPLGGVLPPVTTTVTQVENLTGGALNDVLSGDSSRNVLMGMAGSDQLFGAAGDDELHGGAGNDLLNGGDGFDIAGYSLERGPVTVNLSLTAPQNTGTATGSDTLTSIEGVYGSAFDDLLIGNAGTNLLVGNMGNDNLAGGAGSDTLAGGNGNDVLHGDEGDDVLQGDEGNDTLIGGTGNDELIGGTGADAVDYRSSTSGVTARLDVGTASDGFGGLDTLAEIEDIWGSGFNDVMVGNQIGNWLFGGTGSDVILGLDGNDVISGGTGAANEIHGGAGDDTYIVETAGDTIIEYAGEGVDTVETALGQLSIAVNIENLFYTGSQNFVGIGNSGNNVIGGGAGSDVLLGLAGNDILIGGSGIPNELHGGQGDDYYIITAPDTIVEQYGEGVDTVEARTSSYTLGANVENLVFGGTGTFVGSGNNLNNLLQGGDDNDILYGQGGDDLFLGTSGTDIYDGGSGLDTLRLEGERSEYEITAITGGWRIQRDGLEYNIFGIENVEFSDATYDTTVTDWFL